MGVSRPSWWNYPTKCEAGHEWAPGLVVVAWHPCDCPRAIAQPGRGHLVVRCGTPGCTSAWFKPRCGPVIKRNDPGSRRARNQAGVARLWGEKLAGTPGRDAASFYCTTPHQSNQSAVVVDHACELPDEPPTAATKARPDDL